MVNLHKIQFASQFSEMSDFSADSKISWGLLSIWSFKQLSSIAENIPGKVFIMHEPHATY